MTKTAIALAGAALLLGGLAAPATAASQNGTVVRNLKISKAGPGCLRLKWQKPAQDSGDTFGIVIRTKSGSEMYRVETYKTRAKVCDLNDKTYQILVKQYGGNWAKSSVELG